VLARQHPYTIDSVARKFGWVKRNGNAGDEIKYT